MHSVTSSEAPEYLETLSQIYYDPDTGHYIWDLSSQHHLMLIADLARQFGAPRRLTIGETGKPDPNEGICAYCERVCSKVPMGPSANQIDHFYPRSGRNDLTFVWSNLMYICKRCNESKNDRAFIENLNLDLDSYVNPREVNAESYFSFEVKGSDCRIIPNKNLQIQSEIEKARRTIDDLNLDAVDTILNRNLRLLRANYLANVCSTLAVLSPQKRRSLLNRLTGHGSQFSSLIAWARDTGYFDS